MEVFTRGVDVLKSRGIVRGMKRFSFIVMLLIGVAGARGEFTPPANNIYTEEQLTNYIGAVKDWMDYLKAAGKALEGSKSGMAALSVYAKTDQKFRDSLAKHHLEEAEYTWLADQVFKAWGGLTIQEALEQSGKEVDQQIKDTDAKIAEQKKIIEARQDALKTGRRIMTKEQRDSAIESAKSEKQSALEEAKSHQDASKQHADEAKAAADEAAKARRAGNG